MGERERFARGGLLEFGQSHGTETGKGFYDVLCQIFHLGELLISDIA